MSSYDIKEGIQPQKKVLRLDERYGAADGGGIFVLQGRDPTLERLVIDVFREAGYTIERGTFIEENHREIGIHARSYSDIEGLREQKLVQITGAELPKRYSFEEVLKLNIPIVAKDLRSDRGADKYLLETAEQKARFIAWAAIDWNRPLLAYPEQSGISAENILAMVREAKFNHTLLHTEWLSEWVFEENIVTPGNRNTSYRIVADAFGKIHYGVLNYSAEVRNQCYIEDTVKFRYPPLIQATVPGQDVTILLTHPDSPFYLHAKKITSNVSAGASYFLLNGTPLNDEVTRQVAIDHGIDPYDPRIPSVLIELSKKIGIASRGDFPYVGIDFLQRISGSYVFLEANKGPALHADALDVPNTSTPQTLVLEMMKRVLQHNI